MSIIVKKLTNTCQVTAKRLPENWQLSYFLYISGIEKRNETVLTVLTKKILENEKRNDIQRYETHTKFLSKDKK
jgi:hypothetical protein